MPDSSRCSHQVRRGRPSARSLALTCALLILCVLFVPGPRAEVTVGLYADPAGSMCSLTGNAPGPFSAYVVVRPDGAGFVGVRFSVPVPSCLGATYVNEIVPPGMVSLGESRTGISIALASCSGVPTAVLQINYLRTSTEPCCEYPVLPDPLVGFVEAVDCAFNSVTAGTVAGHFNADESCSCAGNSAPNPPSNPVPVDNAPAESIHALLSWYAADADNDPLEFDVYLGTVPAPPLAAAHVPQAYYDPGLLQPLTTYYWRVVARDDMGLETSSPVWRFTTRVANSPPYPPVSPSPDNGAGGVLPGTMLTWRAQDIDGDPVVCDVYFGTSSSPPLVTPDFAGVAGWFSYAPPALAYGTTYWWRIVARDPSGAETSGPTWWFTTRPENYPPSKPAYSAPANGATGVALVATLRWSSYDPDGDAITYDVHFGTTSPPPLMIPDHPYREANLGPLAYETTYYWRIIARDALGAETAGDVWSFTTRATNLPPAVPSSPSPASGSTGRPLNQVLTWQCSDIDGDTLRYDVYFGTVEPLPKVTTILTTRSYAPPGLAFTTTYLWRIVARDHRGAETVGPTWTFTTKADQPPGIPYGPSPATNSTGRPLTQTLAWQCTEPDGQPMTYDLYFGTASTPPLLASDLPAKGYSPVLAYLTKYYWRVVARDATGLETSGPTWNFTTAGNAPPAVPSNPIPANGSAVAQLTPNLTWIGSDPDGPSLSYDVYFGTVSPPPLAATGLAQASYAPGTLTLGGLYYWRVVAKDGISVTGGPTWSFLVAEPGDVNLDGVFDVADARCAFQVFLQNPACAGAQGTYLANVDCAGGVTPRDARCLHKKALDGSCAFCGTAAAAPEKVLGPTHPTVVLHDTWTQGDTLYARLAVAGIPSIGSFGFAVYCDGGVRLVRPARRGITTAFVALDCGAPASSAMVGGYSLGSMSGWSYTEFLDLHFVRTGWPGSTYVQIPAFFDDLAGAYPLDFYVGEGGNVPVLFTAFDAVLRGDGVEVSWELASDESMERFELLRRDDGSSPPVVVSAGSVTGPRDRHLDTTVEAGRTYRYELVVYTAAGDIFRSPERTVTLAPLDLALHQNHPNPFNPQTTIRYELPAGGTRVRLWVLDPAGRIVRTLVDEARAGGTHEVVWDGRDDRGQGVSSGVYFYVLDAGGERRTRKLVLLK